MKIPWRRKWQTTPLFLPGESQGQRSLMAYSPQELQIDTAEQLIMHTCDIYYTATISIFKRKFKNRLEKINNFKDLEIKIKITNDIIRIFWAPESLQMVIGAMKLKDVYSSEKKL